MNGGLAQERTAVNLLSPAEVRQQIGEVAARRLAVLGHAEHLAFSALVPEAVATRFAAMHEACRRAWYDKARPLDWSGAALRPRLEEILRPIAGSERDWNRTAQALDSITRAAAHPRHFLQLLSRRRWR